MVDAVLAGDGLDAVATLTAEAAGGAVAIVLPAVGSAVAGAGAERRLAAVRRFVAARLAGQPGALPAGYVADALVGSQREKLGAVVLLDDGRPAAAGAQAVLRLAAVAALALAAVRDAAGDGARAAGALLDDLRRAPLEAEGLVARARRLGVDLAAGAVALRVAAGTHGSRAAAVVQDVAPGGLVLRRGEEVDALLPGERADAEQRARAIVARLSSYAAVGFSSHEPSPGRLHDALREADVALGLVRGGEAAPADAAAGAWQLLVRLAVTDPGAVRRLRDTSIGPALAHDADHGSDLVGTFRTYLAHGANMNAAAAAIPAHRHTVAYRFERLRELTGLHPARADDRERLGLGVKAQVVLEALAQVR
jgi:sugar diacid utilization regulator